MWRDLKKDPGTEEANVVQKGTEDTQSLTWGGGWNGDAPSPLD